jgi:hypothetical protein
MVDGFGSRRITRAASTSGHRLRQRSARKCCSAPNHDSILWNFGGGLHPTPGVEEERARDDALTGPQTPDDLHPRRSAAPSCSSKNPWPPSRSRVVSNRRLEPACGFSPMCSRTAHDTSGPACAWTCCSPTPPRAFPRQSARSCRSSMPPHEAGRYDSRRTTPATSCDRTCPRMWRCRWRLRRRLRFRDTRFSIPGLKKIAFVVSARGPSRSPPGFYGRSRLPSHEHSMRSMGDTLMVVTVVLARIL